jgi:hypothetical protein
MGAEGHEYRVKVDWFRDCSDKPIGVVELKERLGYTPRGAVKIIRKHRIEVETMLDAFLFVPPPSCEASRNHLKVIAHHHLSESLNFCKQLRLPQSCSAR